MRPQHLATLDQAAGSSDAALTQASQTTHKAYLFKPLPYTLNLGHIPVVRAAQRGRDWSVGQTHPGDRSRSITWKNSLKLSQHSVFWPSWRPATKVGSSKITWPQSPLWPRSQLNPCLRASITKYGIAVHGTGRGSNPAPIPVARSKGLN